MSTMDLFLAQAGPFRLALAASQVTRVAPCPSDLTWPPAPDGFMGRAPAGPGRETYVVDPLARWHGAVASSQLPVVSHQKTQTDYRLLTTDCLRERPRVLLVLVGDALALAVDSYALGTHPVHAGPAVLRERGIHALAPLGDGYAIVLDMSRLVAGVSTPPAS